MKYAGLAAGGIVLVLLACVAWGFHVLDAGVCANQVLGSYPSPGGTKKTILFVRDCGATTGWSVHASIIASAEELHDTDTGNVFVADSDRGAAAKSNPIGGPAVTTVWIGPDELEIGYSRGARVFLAAPEFDRTYIRYSAF